MIVALESQDSNRLHEIGFRYLSDIGYSDDNPQWEDWGAMFEFQAEVLGCSIDQIAFADTEDNYDLYARIINMIKAAGEQPIPIPNDRGHYGHNELYDLNGVKILATGQMGGYYTITICG